MTTVSVVIPARNEAAFIERAIRSIRAQTHPALEIIVVDGASEDETAAIAERLGATVLLNRARIVSTALNMVIYEARGDVIARLDAHAEASPRYLELGLRAIEERGAWSVGGRIIHQVTTPTQAAIAEATSTALLGAPTEARWVDTAPYGMWPRWVFDRVGRFNIWLVRNQDDEYSLRIRRAGGQIWYDPEITFLYHPRASWQDFARQQYEYGFWRVEVWDRHGWPSPRALLPVAWASALVMGLAAMLTPVRWRLLVPAAAAYLSMVLARTRRPAVVRAYATMHTSYGIGVLAAVFFERVYYPIALRVLDVLVQWTAALVYLVHYVITGIARRRSRR